MSSSMDLFVVQHLLSFNTFTFWTTVRKMSSSLAPTPRKLPLNRPSTD
jgi:hypothetical protein